MNVQGTSFILNAYVIANIQIPATLYAYGVISPVEDCSNEDIADILERRPEVNALSAARSILESVQTRHYYSIMHASNTSTAMSLWKSETIFNITSENRSYLNEQHEQKNALREMHLSGFRRLRIVSANRVDNAPSKTKNTDVVLVNLRIVLQFKLVRIV